jgi:hypothetical protein
MAMMTTKTIEKLLADKECSLWPDCSCRSTLLLWQDNFQDEAAVWSREELDWAEDIIFLSLSCVEHYCPDKKLRRYAAQQLMNPFWDRQRCKPYGVKQ